MVTIEHHQAPGTAPGTSRQSLSQDCAVVGLGKEMEAVARVGGRSGRRVAYAAVNRRQRGVTIRNKDREQLELWISSCISSGKVAAAPEVNC